jgi:light-regulated signal transduction histidine kinase (bacteriophytochrome)
VKINLNNLILKIDNPQEIKIRIPENLPTIHGDKHRLELLFNNFIHNAVKFNDKGKNGCIEINYDDQKHFWKFTVKDNGKGIENEYFDKIFVAFQKLENDNKPTGIGLSIVKKMIGGLRW